MPNYADIPSRTVASPSTRRSKALVVAAAFALGAFAAVLLAGVSRSSVTHPFAARTALAQSRATIPHVQPIGAPAALAPPVSHFLPRLSECDQCAIQCSAGVPSKMPACYKECACGTARPAVMRPAMVPEVDPVGAPVSRFFPRLSKCDQCAIECSAGVPSKLPACYKECACGTARPAVMRPAMLPEVDPVGAPVSRFFPRLSKCDQCAIECSGGVPSKLPACYKECACGTTRPAMVPEVDPVGAPVSRFFPRLSKCDQCAIQCSGGVPSKMPACYKECACGTARPAVMRPAMMPEVDPVGAPVSRFFPRLSKCDQCAIQCSAGVPSKLPACYKECACSVSRTTFQPVHSAFHSIA